MWLPLCSEQAHKLPVSSFCITPSVALSSRSSSTQSIPVSVQHDVNCCCTALPTLTYPPPPTPLPPTLLLASLYTYYHAY